MKSTQACHCWTILLRLRARQVASGATALERHCHHSCLDSRRFLLCHAPTGCQQPLAGSLQASSRHSKDHKGERRAASKPGSTFGHCNKPKTSTQHALPHVMRLHCAAANKAPERTVLQVPVLPDLC